MFFPFDPLQLQNQYSYLYLIYTYYCNDNQKIKCSIILLQNINIPSDHSTQVTNDLLVLKYLINIHLNIYFTYRAL